MLTKVALARKEVINAYLCVPGKANLNMKCYGGNGGLEREPESQNRTGN